VAGFVLSAGQAALFKDNNGATGVGEGFERLQANVCAGPSDEYSLVV